VNSNPTGNSCTYTSPALQYQGLVYTCSNNATYTLSGAPPTGSASGDLSGAYPSPSISGTSNAVYATSYAGADIGAQINAAVTAGQLKIWIPCGTFNYATPIVLDSTTGVELSGCGPGLATKLVFTGTASTGALTARSSAHLTLKNFALLWNSNNLTGPVINGQKLPGSTGVTAPDTAFLTLDHVELLPSSASFVAAPSSLLLLDGSHDVSIRDSLFNGGTYNIVGKLANNISGNLYNAAPTYVSGGTLTGTGTCVVASSGGGGSGGQLTVTVTGGAFTSFSVLAAGSGYTSMPTTWTYVSGTACSTSITTSGGSLLLTGGYAIQVLLERDNFAQATTAALRNADNNWKSHVSTFEPIQGNPAPAGALIMDSTFTFKGLEFDESYFSDEGAAAGTWISVGGGSSFVFKGNFCHASSSETCLAFTSTSLSGVEIGGNSMQGSGTGVGIAFGSTPPTQVSIAGNNWAGLGNNYTGTLPSDQSSLGKMDFGTGSIGMARSIGNVAPSVCNQNGYIFNTGNLTSNVIGYCDIPKGTLTAGSRLRITVWEAACTALNTPFNPTCTAANTGTCGLKVAWNTSNANSGTALINNNIAIGFKAWGEEQIANTATNAQTLDALYFTQGNAITMFAPTTAAIDTSSGSGTDSFVVIVATNSVSADECAYRWDVLLEQ
jgi:hypothetical protein